MKKSLQLHIPQPCHEDWQQMTAAEKGRFCDVCQKTVVDFTYMTDREIVDYFTAQKGRLCGRFQADQLNRPIQVLKENNTGWLKYFFHIALPAVLFLTRAEAQTKPAAAPVTLGPAPVRLMGDTIIVAPPSAPATRTIRGRVTDENGEGLLFATVVVKGTRQGVATDTARYFRLQVKDLPGPVTLVASCIGFTTTEKRVAFDKGNEENFVLVPMETQLSGEVAVVVVGMIAEKAPPRRTPLELCRSLLKMDSVTIYPNPAVAGSSLYIRMQVKQTGEYGVHLLNLKGETILIKKTLINAKRSETELPVGDMLPGYYVITVVSPEKKIMASKKIQIQHN